MLERRNGALIVVIEDDGCGFDFEVALNSTEAGRSHLGLFGMQERAELLGGRLTIEAKDGRGTTVFTEIPLRDE
jgi:signal transduction histidine kinase